MEKYNASGAVPLRPYLRPRGSSLTLSLQRPFSLRALSTLRPARVFIRERKPCLRRRRIRFG